MKNLNNTLFKKLEPNKVTNLAKVVGGAKMETKHESGKCDFFSPATPCGGTRLGFVMINGVKVEGDVYYTEC